MLFLLVSVCVTSKIITNEAFRLPAPHYNNYQNLHHNNLQQFSKEKPKISWHIPSSRIQNFPHQQDLNGDLETDWNGQYNVPSPTYHQIKQPWIYSTFIERTDLKPRLSKENQFISPFVNSNRFFDNNKWINQQNQQTYLQTPKQFYQPDGYFYSQNHPEIHAGGINPWVNHELIKHQYGPERFYQHPYLYFLPHLHNIPRYQQIVNHPVANLRKFKHNENKQKLFMLPEYFVKDLPTYAVILRKSGDLPQGEQEIEFQTQKNLPKRIMDNPYYQGLQRYQNNPRQSLELKQEPEHQTPVLQQQKNQFISPFAYLQINPYKQKHQQKPAVNSRDKKEKKNTIQHDQRKQFISPFKNSQYLNYWVTPRDRKPFDTLITNQPKASSKAPIRTTVSPPTTTENPIVSAIESWFKRNSNDDEMDEVKAGEDLAGFIKKYGPPVFKELQKLKNL